MVEDILDLVNDNDEATGFASKSEVHRKGLLHRAFSVFLYNSSDNTLLIHRRATGKYHSGGLWTNTCCSHPRKEETLMQAVKRRMDEELGISLQTQDMGEYHIHKLGSFKYFYQFENCSEHEIDHVFSIVVCREIYPINYDRNEIEEIQWIKLEKLEKWMLLKPADFTAWFTKAYILFKNHIKQ